MLEEGEGVVDEGVERDLTLLVGSENVTPRDNSNVLTLLGERENRLPAVPTKLDGIDTSEDKLNALRVQVRRAERCEECKQEERRHTRTASDPRLPIHGSLTTAPSPRLPNPLA